MISPGRNTRSAMSDAISVVAHTKPNVRRLGKSENTVTPSPNAKTRVVTSILPTCGHSGPISVGCGQRTGSSMPSVRLPDPSRCWPTSPATPTASPSPIAAWSQPMRQALPSPTRIALELGEAGHDGAHQLPACSAKIEAEPCLSQHADFPAVEIVQRLDEVLRAPAPSAELGDQDGINLAGSGECQNLGAFGAPIVGA